MKLELRIPDVIFEVTFLYAMLVNETKRDITNFKNCLLVLEK